MKEPDAGAESSPAPTPEEKQRMFEAIEARLIREGKREHREDTRAGIVHVMGRQGRSFGK